MWPWSLLICMLFLHVLVSRGLKNRGKCHCSEKSNIKYNWVKIERKENYILMRNTLISLKRFMLVVHLGVNHIISLVILKMGSLNNEYGVQMSMWRKHQRQGSREGRMMGWECPFEEADFQWELNGWWISTYIFYWGHK